ncbi:MAG: pentapeptide repeat-containing protein [Ignavibacteriaceae bacterium]
MQSLYFEDKNFNKINFEEKPLKKGEYEKCEFTNCSFYKSDISEILFVDCIFKACNLSLVEVSETTFNNVSFTDCKLMGIHFENCNDFGLSFKFENCILDHSSFFRKKIRNTHFKNSQLIEVDFTEADLTGSVFSGCDLKRTIFDNTIIEKADLRTSFNFSIDPEINRIKKAKFSFPGIAGLLDKYDIEIEGR